MPSTLSAVEAQHFSPNDNSASIHNPAPAQPCPKNTTSAHKLNHTGRKLTPLFTQTRRIQATDSSKTQSPQKIAPREKCGLADIHLLQHLTTPLSVVADFPSKNSSRRPDGGSTVIRERPWRCTGGQFPGAAARFTPGWCSVPARISVRGRRNCRKDPAENSIAREKFTA